MAQHPELGGDELELLRDLLADAFERGAILAADLLFIRQVVEDLDARDPFRQRLAAPLPARVCLNEDGGVFFVAGVFGRALGFVEQTDLLVRALLALLTKALVLGRRMYSRSVRSSSDNASTRDSFSSSSSDFS